LLTNLRRNRHAPPKKAVEKVNKPASWAGTRFCAAAAYPTLLISGGPDDIPVGSDSATRGCEGGNPGAVMDLDVEEKAREIRLTFGGAISGKEA
jgi:hypothetical protein